MKRPTRHRLNGALLVAVLILASLVCGTVYAKYVKQQSFTGTMTLTAQLGSITVEESKANRQSDGSYILTSTQVKTNSYELLPGLDIPKDPTVSVDKESTIPVYVFLEVTDTIETQDEDVIAFTVDPVWKAVAGVTGIHGGQVYVYAPGGSPAVVKEDVASINVLAGQTVTVSQKLKQVTGQVEILFYAEMRQITAVGQDPAAVYGSTDY